MPQRQAGLEAIIWTDAAKTPLVRDVLDRMGSAVQPIAVGGPSSGDVVRLAGHLDCAGGDDLRKLIIDQPAAFVLLATAARVDATAVAPALDQGSTVLALEPVTAGFDDLVALAGGPNGMPIGTTGRGLVASPAMFLRCPGWMAVADPIDVLSTPRVIQFTNIGAAKERSLFARFYEAWEVVLRFGQLPQTVDASVTGPLAHLPEDVRALTGHLTAHARFDDAAAALVVASDAVGKSTRTLTLTGDEAHLRVDDMSYELHDASGKQLDGHRRADAPCEFADLVAYDWTRLIDRGSAAPTTASRTDHVLACCVACLLSARTGQVESPAKILAMQRRSRSG